MSETTAVVPVHEPSQHRWTVALEGELAVLDYTLADATMDIHHTGVPKALGGRGIAGALVRAALDYARAEGYRVHPSCSYAATWMDRHPDYAGLRTE